MNAEDFKALAVVSIATGAKLGYVDDVLFDLQQLAVAAFEVKGDGERGLIAFGDVRNVGSDALMVPSDDVLKNAGAAGPLSDLPGLGRVGRLKVVDEAGTYMGRVQEIDVDPQSGSITEVRAHEGGVLGIGGKRTIIGRAGIRSAGDEVMVVARQTDDG